MKNISKFDKLRRSFLCCIPIKLICWKDLLSGIDWDDQQLFLEATVQNDLNQKYPINRNYQALFLKAAVKYLEDENIEINDCLYECYCSFLVNMPTNKFAYKHYIVNDLQISISLKESNSFVMDGTTGLCSWQAGIALSEWCLQNRQFMENKSVLELGAGTGLCGIITAKCCKPSKVLLTDGSEKVLDLLHDNLVNNFNEATSGENTFTFHNEATKIGTMLLPWEDVDTITLPHDFVPDVLLAADVVYDSSVFVPLANTIEKMFSRNSRQCTLLLAATVRNEDTLKGFLEIIASKNLTICEENLSSQFEKQLVWDESTPIKIFKIC